MIFTSTVPERTPADSWMWIVWMGITGCGYELRMRPEVNNNAAAASYFCSPCFPWNINSKQTNQIKKLMRIHLFNSPWFDQIHHFSKEDSPLRWCCQHSWTQSQLTINTSDQVRKPACSKDLNSQTAKFLSGLLGFSVRVSLSNVSVVWKTLYRHFECSLYVNIQTKI